ncbi:uncharacterized protein [Anas acuta]|uniref:uncharacterized protein isoform X2 n=1 Tax=Anas acuta TaxID=28680 RepID=UPI0035C89A2C
MEHDLTLLCVCRAFDCASCNIWRPNKLRPEQDPNRTLQLRRDKHRSAPGHQQHRHIRTQGDQETSGAGTGGAGTSGAAISPRRRDFGAPIRPALEQTGHRPGNTVHRPHVNRIEDALIRQTKKDRLLSLFLQLRDAIQGRTAPYCVIHIRSHQFSIGLAEADQDGQRPSICQQKDQHVYEDVGSNAYHRHPIFSHGPSNCRTITSSLKGTVSKVKGNQGCR